MRTDQTNQHLPKGIKLLTPEELIQHAYCVEVAGYTILRNQVPDIDLQTYREVCTRVLDHGANGRCLYCWGTETLKILEHDTIDQLATRVMGEYKFWDLYCGCAMPAAEGVQYPPKVEYPPMNDLGWHRDFGRDENDEERPDYLYFFVCLVDINDENGATWIVPGSHRRSTRHEPMAFDGSEKWVASAIQVRANAGDIVVLNPSTFHAPGWNYTHEPRLIMSVGLVSQREPARYNHWQIAAPIRERLTGRVERLLKPSETHYEKDPELPPPDLPEGWPVTVQVGGKSTGICRHAGFIDSPNSNRNPPLKRFETLSKFDSRFTLYGGRKMRIATADSGCSILDSDFKPINILSTVGLVMDGPYEKPMRLEACSADYAVTDANVLVYELQLCQRLLAAQEADCVHLDLNLGGINVLDITDEYLFQTPLSQMGRSVLRAILPTLRDTAMQIAETYHIPVLAMGKRSAPVRLAELYAAAYGVQRSLEKIHIAQSPIYVGLPPRVLASFEAEGMVRVCSAEPMEESLTAEVPIEKGVSVEHFLNPVARGFQVLKIGR